MPRVYKRKLEAGKYMHYSPETLEACLNTISPRECTIKDAEAETPKQTFCYKRKQLHVRKLGRPLIFSNEEEKAVASGIVHLSEFGFGVE
ncbi:hypothetical protein AVEN_65188-1 [Araneus ventricosus]|uniref:Uncharacterized protein n=1 Tax=Araneus ventricosus TaxID=182803 RepID=A0A4Y2AHA3_ARAVE|nr:hypothetical protein AVEN_65188-1 [Araneus ventricosus]